MRKEMIKKVLFIIGFLLCIYPLLSSMLDARKQKNIITTYNNNVKETEESQLKGELEKAETYNNLLFQSQGVLLDNLQEDSLSEESYNALLNQTKNGIMGSIEIPKINVDLAIYHTVEEEVLENGVGHFKNSSLPVGGKNTHSILTAHRGLPSAKLFTRLDELEKGDYFFLNILNNTLAYKVKEIKVIKPEELELLKIFPEQDLVSLVTCTPYGINTHRLVVTGERVSYEKKTHDAITPSLASSRELLFIAIPFGFLAIMILFSIKEKRKRSISSEKKEV